MSNKTVHKIKDIFVTTVKRNLEVQLGMIVIRWLERCQLLLLVAMKALISPSNETTHYFYILYFTRYIICYICYRQYVWQRLYLAVYYVKGTRTGVVCLTGVPNLVYPSFCYVFDRSLFLGSLFSWLD